MFIKIKPLLVLEKHIKYFRSLIKELFFYVYVFIWTVR